MHNRQYIERSGGFTLLELLVVISIIAVLAGMFLKRVSVYQEMAERAAMQQVLGAVQTGLVLEMANRLSHGLDYTINGLVNENPFNWLMQKPSNYAGELTMARPEMVPAGKWAYDLTSRELLYAPAHIEFFKPAVEKEMWIRYRVRPLYDVVTTRSGGKKKQIVGLVVASVEPYEWLVKE